jgi:hypothetical protein
MTKLLGLVSAFVLTGSMAWADAGKPLSGREIELLFSGAAMRGDFVADGSAWAERTTKSGRVLDLLQGGRHVGAWFVAGDRMCYVYFGKPPATPCYVIANAGGEIQFIDPKDGRLVARAKSIKRSRR